MCKHYILLFAISTINLVQVLESDPNVVRARVLPEDYAFAGHRELVGMQLGDAPVNYVDSKQGSGSYMGGGN